MPIDFDEWGVLLVSKNKKTKLSCWKDVGGDIRIKIIDYPESGIASFDLESIEKLVYVLEQLPEPVE